MGLAFAAQPPVILKTYIQPPYQMAGETRLEGSVSDTLDCIFNTLHRPYELTLGPRKRNRELIKNGRIDGFLLSMPDHELDRVAVATDPIVLERWKYFRSSFSALPELPGAHRVGAVLGSNEAIWLTQTGQATAGSIPNVTSLVKLLNSERIPYALADEKSLHAAVEEAHVSTVSFRSTFVKYVPLVAYFSNSFILQNQGFIDQFNKTLNTCAQDINAATQSEKEDLLFRSEKFIGLHKDKLIEMLKGQVAPNLDIKQMYLQDALWIKAVLNNEKTPLIEGVLANDISRYLHDVALQFPEITEIFLTNEKGFIVGMNKTTSDYWQGNEDAHLALVNKGEASYVSDILFDHSTHKFQIQISLPLKDKISDQCLGILTIGFDASKAFFAQAKN